MRTPFTWKPPTPIESTMATSNAMITGPPTTSPMNTVRRDHSIWPSDRSKTRRVDERNEGVCGVAIVAVT